MASKLRQQDGSYVNPMVDFEIPRRNKILKPPSHIRSDCIRMDSCPPTITHEELPPLSRTKRVAIFEPSSCDCKGIEKAESDASFNENSSCYRCVSVKPIIIRGVCL